VPVAGVPENVPPDENVTPLGSAPDSEYVGDGLPVAATWNDPDCPAMNVCDTCDVVNDGPLSTVSVNG